MSTATLQECCEIRGAYCLSDMAGWRSHPQMLWQFCLTEGGLRLTWSSFRSRINLVRNNFQSGRTDAFYLRTVEAKGRLLLVFYMGTRMELFIFFELGKRNDRKGSRTCLFLCTYIVLHLAWMSLRHQMMTKGVQSAAKFTADCFMRKKMLGRNMMAKLNDNKWKTSLCSCAYNVATERWSSMLNIKWHSLLFPF